MQVLINETIKREFKAACVMDGKNMSEVVETLVTEWLNERNTQDNRTQDKTTERKTRQKKQSDA